MTTRTTVATADIITMPKSLPFLSVVESKSGMHIENYIQKQIVQNMQEKKTNKMHVDVLFRIVQFVVPLHGRRKIRINKKRILRDQKCFIILKKNLDCCAILFLKNTNRFSRKKTYT